MVDGCSTSQLEEDVMAGHYDDPTVNSSSNLLLVKEAMKWNHDSTCNSLPPLSLASGSSNSLSSKGSSNNDQLLESLQTSTLKEGHLSLSNQTKSQDKEVKDILDLEGRQRTVSELVAHWEKHGRFAQSRCQHAVPGMISVKDLTNKVSDDGSIISKLTVPNELYKNNKAKGNRMESKERRSRGSRKYRKSTKAIPDQLPDQLPDQQSPSRRHCRRRRTSKEKEKKNSSTTVPEKRRLCSTTESTSASQLVSTKGSFVYPGRDQSSSSISETTQSDGSCRARGMTISLTIGGRIEQGWYSGTLEDGLPSGVGVVRFRNRDLYIGEMENGEMHGKGTLVFNEFVLRGDFQHNLYVV